MKVNEDPVIDRIRAVRHEISAEFGHDTKRLVAHYVELQKEYADRLKNSKVREHEAELTTK